MTDHSCVHHEAIEIKIEANKKRIHRVEKGFIYMYSLLIANLASVIVLLVRQLVTS